MTDANSFRNKMVKLVEYVPKEVNNNIPPPPKQQYNTNIQSEKARRASDLLTKTEKLTNDEFYELVRLIIFSLDFIIVNHYAKLVPHNLEPGLGNDRNYVDKSMRHVSNAITALHGIVGNT